jgi:ribosomal protein L4
MSIFTKQQISGKPRCARCHRPFTPKGDEIWGPTCARKMHAQLTHINADLAETRHTVIV